LLVIGSVSITIASTIYFKKLWDDDGSESVSATVGKNLFFFNLAIAIISLLIFLALIFKWYDLYYNFELKDRPKSVITPKIIRGYDIEEPTEEERMRVIRDRITNSTRERPAPVFRKGQRGIRGFRELAPVYEEVSTEENLTVEEDMVLSEETDLPNSGENAISNLRRRIMFSNTPVRNPRSPMTPYMPTPDNFSNTPMSLDTSFRRDEDNFIPTRLDFNKDTIRGSRPGEVYEYTIDGTYENGFL